MIIIILLIFLGLFFLIYNKLSSTQKKVMIAIPIILVLGWILVLSSLTVNKNDSKTADQGYQQ